MLRSFSTQSLKSSDHFSDLWVEIALSHRHVEKRWFFWVKRVHGLPMIGYNISANTIHPMLAYCWYSVADAGPTLNRHWVNVSNLLWYNQCLRPIERHFVWHFPEHDFPAVHLWSSSDPSIEFSWLLQILLLLSYMTYMNRIKRSGYLYIVHVTGYRRRNCVITSLF